MSIKKKPKVIAQRKRIGYKHTGVFRRSFPKKTDLTTVSKKEIEAVEKKLNKRPIKKFNFETTGNNIINSLLLVECSRYILT